LVIMKIAKAHVRLAVLLAALLAACACNWLIDESNDGGTSPQEASRQSDISGSNADPKANTLPGPTARRPNESKLPNRASPSTRAGSGTGPAPRSDTEPASPRVNYKEKLDAAKKGLAPDLVAKIDVLRVYDAKNLEVHADRVSEWVGTPNHGNTCFFNATLAVWTRNPGINEALAPNAGDDSETTRLKEALRLFLSLKRMGKLAPGYDGGALSLASMSYAVLTLLVAMEEFDEARTKSGGEKAFEQFFKEAGRQQDANAAARQLAVALNLEYAPGRIEVQRIAKPWITAENRYLENKIRTAGRESYSMLPMAGATVEAGRENVQAVVNSNWGWREKDEQNPLDFMLDGPKTVPLPYSGRYMLSGPLPSHVTFALNRYFCTPHPTDKTKPAVEKVDDKRLDLSHVLELESFTAAGEGDTFTLTSTEKKQYDLVGIVVHSGSLAGGHYYAFVRDAAGKWYNHDDSNASPVADLARLEETAGLTQNYAVLYQKQ
jgi:hypothetical protein